MIKFCPCLFVYAVHIKYFLIHAIKIRIKCVFVTAKKKRKKIMTFIKALKSKVRKRKEI